MRGRPLVAAALWGALSASVALAQAPQPPPQVRLPRAAAPAGVSLRLPYAARLADAGYAGTVEVDGARWTCEGGQCRTEAAWPAPTVAQCEALAAQAGRVAAFGQGERVLGKADLGRCNASARATPAGTAGTARSVRGPLVAPAAVGAPLRMDRETRYRSLVDARERALREAEARAAAEREEAREAGRRERERREAAGLIAKWGQGGDCDDTRADVHPLAAEVCDLVDNNCNGLVDEGQTLRMFLDADGDGHGDASKPVDVCPVEQQRAAAEGRWLVPVGNDCDDADPDRWRECP